ncbi:MAG: right-handed parallel beta-helix repeat-containing protein [Planctomycetota bacterium]
MRSLLRGLPVLWALALTLPAFGSDIRVPQDHPTIQAAIAAAINGDTVLVDPGTYTENIDFQGKAITVRSTRGPSVTIIDGGASGPVVTFANFEGSGSVIDGFTIRNGKSDDIGGVFGGGVSCFKASPTIVNNTITGNISDIGGGISIYYSSHPYVANNVIVDNQSTAGGAGAGIGINALSDPVIKNNLIARNVGPGLGGAINVLFNCSPQIINNTITQNSGGTGGAINVFAASPTVWNSILWNNSPDEVYELGGSGSSTITYTTVQGGYPGVGNLSNDPSFIDPVLGDFRLDCASPCIDAGVNLGSPPTHDIEGDLRTVDGDSDGLSIIDMGSDEFDTLFRFNGPATGGASVSFTSLNPPAKNGQSAQVFLSLSDGSLTGGITIPGSGGQKLGLGVDPIFNLWLSLPGLLRQTTLSGCPGAGTFPLTLPGTIPVGLRVYFAGFTTSGGTVTGVTPTSSLVTQ